MNDLAPVLAAAAAYLIGAIPFGYLIARAKGVDITRQGSGNIGATNVGRILGKKLGITVFVLDFAKGALPTLAAVWWAGTPEKLLPVLVGLATVLGHMFPVYLRFKGGKGVATGAGVVFVLLRIPALAGLTTWVAVLCAFGYVSLASVKAGVAMCIVRLFSIPAPFDREHLVLTLFCLLVAGLVVVRHRSNLQRLRLGTEPRLQDSPNMLRLGKTIHVLSVGTWFGTVVFFTLVGLLVLISFDRLTASTTDRPIWLPAPAAFDKARPSERFPEPLAKEQGRRLFGVAVVPLFVWFYGIQSVCAVLALATAWAWRERGRLHRLRAQILLVCIVLVGVSWWLDWEVNRRRFVRSETSDAVLAALQTSSTAPAELVTQADAARKDFDSWHSYSLWTNFAMLALVGVALGMAAHLPEAGTNALLETKLEKPEE